MMSNTVSADSEKAQMLHSTRTRIKEEPTHKQVKLVIQELTANLMAVSHPWGHEKVHLGLLQDPPSTLLVMEPSLTSQLPNLLHIPLSQPEQPHPNTRNYGPPMLPLARHGQPIAWSSPSHVTSLLPPLMMSTTPYWTIQLKASTALICVRLSHTS